MMILFNTLGRRRSRFSTDTRSPVTVFTCGPSVYQPAHIGNFRTFLFEDILVRYLEYSGHSVVRGMIFTDIEDKAVTEAAKRHMTVKQLTSQNIAVFLREMKTLRMKIPDHLPRASEHYDDAAALIRTLMKKGIAYSHGKNIYFSVRTVKGFGRLFGIDMSRWPKQVRRFHRDTYPGVQWNRGDFVLWHGCTDETTVCRDSAIGRGRPAWNIQDASAVAHLFRKPLSIYCGGIDNLYRHHDYSIAILEACRPYPMARFWLHGEHLLVKGKKMSKSRGNIVYTDTLLQKGASPEDVRFFLIYTHYRKKLSFTDERFRRTSAILAELRDGAARTRKNAGRAAAAHSTIAQQLEKTFAEHMDNDLDVKAALDAARKVLAAYMKGPMSPGESAAVLVVLKKIDQVLQVIF